MKSSIFASCLLATASLCHGQVYSPPAESAQPQKQPDTPQDKPAKSSQTSSPLGQEIPMLDPAAETIVVGGVTIPLGDNRLLKARFEKFLSQPPESNDAATRYRETISKILSTISPFKAGGPDLFAAFRLLPSASSYPGDANLCGTLAESIYMSMLSRQDIRGLSQLNASIEEEKISIIAEGDWKSRHDPKGDMAKVDAGAEKGKPKSTHVQSVGSGANSIKYAETLKRIAEIEVLKKANIV